MLRWLMEWIAVLAFVGDAQHPDDCWRILEHDLADWPDGITAAKMCTDRFPAYYERPARESCELWNEMLESREKRLSISEDLHHTELETLQMVVGWWERDECGTTHRDRLLVAAERQRGERLAEWACEWDADERNERRARRGRKEVDSEQCWIHAGGTRWRKFYEGP